MMNNSEERDGGALWDMFVCLIVSLSLLIGEQEWRSRVAEEESHGLIFSPVCLAAIGDASVRPAAKIFLDSSETSGRKKKSRSQRVRDKLTL